MVNKSVENKKKKKHVINKKNIYINITIIFTNNNK